MRAVTSNIPTWQLKTSNTNYCSEILLLCTLYSLLLSNHPVTLDVDHDVLDVGVAGPAVLLHDAHLAGPEAVGVGGDGVRVDLDVAVTVGAPQSELLGLTVAVLAQPAYAQLWGMFKFIRFKTHLSPEIPDFCEGEL